MAFGTTAFLAFCIDMEIGSFQDVIILIIQSTGCCNIKFVLAVREYVFRYWPVSVVLCSDVDGCFCVCVFNFVLNFFKFNQHDE
jgi:hypothetical protein